MALVRFFEICQQPATCGNAPLRNQSGRASFVQQSARIKRPFSTGVAEFEASQFRRRFSKFSLLL